MLFKKQKGGFFLLDPPFAFYKSIFKNFLV